MSVTYALPFQGEPGYELRVH